MLQTPKRLRLNNYTSTAPLVQSSAISPIPPLALTFLMTSSNTTANRCCGKLFPCHHAISTPLSYPAPQTPIAYCRSRIQRARWQSSPWWYAARTARSTESTCPIVQLSETVSSFTNALIKNSSKLPLMSPELRNVHRTNSMFFSAHNFPTGPSSLARSCDRIYQ